MKNALFLYAYAAIATATSILPSAATLTAVAAEAKPTAAEAKPTYVLQSARKPGQIDRVEVELKVGGDLKEVAGGKVQRMKMSVVGNLDYHEKTLPTPAGSTAPLRGVRYYNQASAVIKVDEDGVKPALRSQRRLTGVEIDLPKVTLFSPRGTLTRDELDLVDILANSLLLDRLLPDGPVAEGDTWKHSEKLMVALLGLDAASEVDVHSVLSNVTDTAALIELTGRVEGALDGVSTQLELKAKYRFNRQSHRIDWFGLLVKEQRNVGPVKRGVDLVARLLLTITPDQNSKQLTDAALKDASLDPTAELRRLTYKSVDGSWQLSHDRGWYVTDEHSDLAVLRLIERGEFVAQCKVSPLPKLAPGKTIPLSEFQSDVQKALGENFEEFVRAGQRGNDADYQVYRVVVRGKARENVQGKPVELPIQWSYYLLTDKHGHRVALAFSVESNLVERFDTADVELVDAIRFVDPQMASNGKK